VLATNVSRSPADGPTFAATIDTLCATLGPSATVLGDAGFASCEAVAEIEAREIEVLVAVSRPEAGRRYDFRPPPNADAKPPPEPKAAWRRKMQTDDAKAKYKKRKSTRRAGLRHPQERPRHHPLPAPRPRQRHDRMALATLAYNCKRLCTLKAA
jgi:hypothetical protein